MFEYAWWAGGLLKKLQEELAEILFEKKKALENLKRKG